MDYISLLQGAGAGLSWGLSRFLKKKGEEGELVEFKPKRLIQPMLLGLIISGVSMYYGITMDAGFALLMNYGIVAIIDSLGKAVWRSVFGVKWEELD